jgi:hypothetical protein
MLLDPRPRRSLGFFRHDFFSSFWTHFARESQSECVSIEKEVQVTTGRGVR